MNGLPKKEVFVNKWNNDRFSHDGKLYHIIGETYKKSKDLIWLYALYHYKLDHCHPSVIIEDNFAWYNHCKSCVMNIDLTYTSDINKIKSYCVANKEKMKDVLRSPKFFTQINISPFSAIILNDLFSLTDKITSDNILQDKMLKKRKLKLEKLGLIFRSSMKGDWKETTKKLL